MAITHPPQINPQIVHTQRMRFICNTAGASAITYQNLLDAVLVAATTIAGYDMFDVCRVKFVEMWQERIQSNTPLTISCTFPGQSGAVAGNGRVIADTAMGTEPAHVYGKPAKLAGASLWQGSSSLTAFALQVNVGTVIDVGITYKSAADVAPLAAQNALVAAAPGQLYYRGLDGLPIATTKYTPQATEII